GGPAGDRGEVGLFEGEPGAGLLTVVQGGGLDGHPGGLGSGGGWGMAGHMSGGGGGGVQGEGGQPGQGGGPRRRGVGGGRGRRACSAVRSWKRNRPRWGSLIRLCSSRSSSPRRAAARLVSSRAAAA